MKDILANHMEVIPASHDAIPWVLETFLAQRHLVDGWAFARVQSSALKRIIMGRIGRAVVAVPIGYPDEFAGWTVEMDGGILYAYVRDQFRRQGIGMKMLTTVTGTVPIELGYWTEDAEGMARKGLAVTPKQELYYKLLSFTRASDDRKDSHGKATTYQVGT